MADREEGNDESAEAKNSTEEPGTSHSRAAASGVWLVIVCHVLGILYYGGHLAHAVWPWALEVVNPLFQYWS
jgi:hypothetical protein